MDKKQKREEIKLILMELAENRNMSKDYCGSILSRFEKIYSDKFRHFYSDITSLLLSINSQKPEYSNVSIDSLGENIRTIYEFSVENDVSFVENLEKLNDHITMDLARIKEWSSLTEMQQNTYRDIKNANSKMNELEIKMQKTTQDMNSARKRINIASKEATNVKKDLVSIMGIFMGIFSFIQWNFSQYKDLLEYDPFSRVLYIAILNSLLILSLYFVFAIIDFIVHKNPRMAKPFFNPENKYPTMFLKISGSIYILLLVIALYNLHSDTGRKTVNKLENKIESLKVDSDKKNIELQKLLDEKNEEVNRVINEKEQKIEELERKIEGMKEVQENISNKYIKLNLKYF